MVEASTKNLLRDAYRKGLTLLYVGLLVGAAAGWASNLTGETAQEQAELAASIYPFLATLLPLVLLIQVLIDWNRERLDSYDTPVTAMGHLALAGLAGDFLAAIAYVTVAAQIPAIFGSAEALDITTRFFEEWSLGDLLFGALISMVTGLVAGAVIWWRST